MTQVCNIHQSGSAHATPRQWWNMLNTHAAIADVITLTECASPRIRQALATWAHEHDWHLWHPTGTGPGQCAILSRRPITRPRARRLTRLTLKTARKAPIHATTGRTYGARWDTWHSPAHNGGLRPGWPTRVYLSALRALRPFRGNPRVITADWNVDLRRPSFRSRLALPGMSWAVGHKQDGTHGKRVIDGVQTNLRVVQRSRTLPGVDGFDHRAVLTVLAIGGGR